MLDSSFKWYLFYRSSDGASYENLVGTNCFIVNWWRSQNQSSKTAIIVWNMFRTDPKHPQLKWIRRSSKLVDKIKLSVTTGCLNLLCPTSNQQFFRLEWHSKQKPSIFGMLSRGDLCLVHRFIYFCFVHSLYSLRSSGCQNSSFLKPCSLKFEVMRLIKSCNGKIYA